MTKVFKSASNERPWAPATPSSCLAYLGRSRVGFCGEVYLQYCHGKCEKDSSSETLTSWCTSYKKLVDLALVPVSRSSSSSRRSSRNSSCTFSSSSSSNNSSDLVAVAQHDLMPHARDKDWNRHPKEWKTVRVGIAIDTRWKSTAWHSSEPSKAKYAGQLCYPV